MQQRILLTGATGFVGSHVADMVAGTGCTVRMLARPGSRTDRLDPQSVEIVRGALDDPATLAVALHQVDIVIHMAAVTHARSVDDYHRVNARATRVLVRAARDAQQGPRRIVYLSSLAAVGPARDGCPVQADDPPRPLTAYGRGKLGGETACRDASDDFEVVILRAPAVYGPRDRELFRFFRYAEIGWVPLPAGGPRRVQMVHVRDLARAILLAATRPHAEGTFHIAESRSYPMTEVVRLIAEAVGRRARVLSVPRPLVRGIGMLSELRSRIAGSSSMLNREKVRELLAPGWLCETDGARSGLGFEAEIALADGLCDTAAWYREQGWLRA